MDNHEQNSHYTFLLHFALVHSFENRLWVIILLVVRMIKRITPNKNFPQGRRDNSCCGFHTGDGQRDEVTLQLHPKRQKEVRSITPVKNPKRAYLKLGGGRSSSNTSRNSTPSSPHPSQPQSQSYTKTFLQTAATIDRPPIFESFPEKIISKELYNPLVRIRQRFFKVNSLQASPHPSMNRMTRSFLQGEGRRGGVGSVSLGRRFEEQAQDLSQSLLREIEQYRRQYQALLKEQRGLLEEREGNRRHYDGLIGRIREKEDELKALERLRKEEVEKLKRELEEFIRGKEGRAQ